MSVYEKVISSLSEIEHQLASDSVSEAARKNLELLLLEQSLFFNNHSLDTSNLKLLAAGGPVDKNSVKREVSKIIGLAMQLSNREVEILKSAEDLKKWR